jgi:hypothetical protein
MERQSKGSRGLEAYCKGGQDPPWAVAPLKKKTYKYKNVDTINNEMPTFPWVQFISDSVCTLSLAVCLSTFNIEVFNGEGISPSRLLMCLV